LTNTKKKKIFPMEMRLRVNTLLLLNLNAFFFGKSALLHESYNYLEYFCRIWKENNEKEPEL
jgi:hypothetical protein